MKNAEKNIAQAKRKKLWPKLHATALGFSAGVWLAARWFGPRRPHANQLAWHDSRETRVLLGLNVNRIHVWMKDSPVLTEERDLYPTKGHEFVGSGGGTQPRTGLFVTTRRMGGQWRTQTSNGAWAKFKDLFGRGYIGFGFACPVQPETL